MEEPVEPIVSALTERPSVHPSARPSGAFSALRHRSFRLFFYGQLVSLMGIWMQQVALSWLVLTVTNSAFYVGMVNALDSLPVLLLALYAGVVVDRMPRHRIIVVTKVVAMLLSLGLAAAVLSDRASVALIMVVATLYGVVNAFDIPARHTFYGDLVGRDDLVSAVALNSVSFNVTRIVGPVIGGLLLGVTGAGICFLLNGLSYVGVLWGLYRMKVPRFRKPAGPPGSAMANIMAGLRHVARDRRMRTLVILIAILTVFGAPYLVLLPIVARDVMGRGAGTYGWLMAAVGVGALSGALWIAGPARRLPRGRIVVWSSTGFGFLVMSLAAGFVPVIALPLLALTGFAMIVNGAIVNTLLQLLSPEELRGRVISVYTLVAVGFAPLGAVQAGAIAEYFGAPTALAVGGLICVGGAAITLLRTPELRETK